MSNDLSVGRGSKQLVKTSNAGNRGRLCLLQATNYQEIVISKNDNARVRSDRCVVSCNYHQLNGCFLLDQNSIAKYR